MLAVYLASAAAIAVQVPQPASTPPRPSACSPSLAEAAGGVLQAGIRNDQLHHQLVVTAGPFNLPATGKTMDAMPMTMGGQDTLAMQFTWPMSGWYRGFRLEVCDSHGNPLPRELVHHLLVLNYDRRQLLYPISERIVAAGRETEDVIVPKSVGAPMRKGQRLGLYVMWDNKGDREVHGVYLRITFLWMPANQAPRPLAVLPMNMDVSWTPEGENSFAVAPGRSSKSFVFVSSISGRILAVGGHLHDHGESLRLEDVESGKTLVTVAARTNEQGRLLGVSRKLLAVIGDGVRLKANHPYRIVGVYNNTTGDTLPNVMAHMTAMFAPDNFRQWPAVDSADAAYRQDLAAHGALHIHGAMEAMSHPHPSGTVAP